MSFSQAARGGNEEPGIRVDGSFKAEPSSVEKLRGGSALMTGDDLDRGRLSFR